MPIELRWLTTPLASALHVVQYANSPRCVDQTIAEVVALPMRELRVVTASLETPWDAVLDLLVVAAAQPVGTRDIADEGLAKAIGRARMTTSQLERMTAALAFLRSTWKHAGLESTDELLLRAQPLQQQWEARGGGLMSQLTRWLPPELLAEQARVLVVPPVCGGGGKAHPTGNLARIEAVLTDVVPGVPEVLRLGWILASLNTELPLYSVNRSAHRVRDLQELAMIPAILTAGAEVELCGSNMATLAAAIAGWAPDAAQPVQADVLWRWWTTYLETRPDWGVAISALDAMLTA